MFRVLRKWTILTHRYLGIVFSLVFVVWFVSGIAMIYARGMPRLTPETRLERLPALNLSTVRLSAREAADRVGVESPGSVQLLNVTGRPAYRFGGRGAVTVFADDGTKFQMDEVDIPLALLIASAFTGLEEFRLDHRGVLFEADQWMISERGQLPVHKVVADDSAGTVLYISQNSGEVAVMTTRGSRALAWVAAIPHWFYLKSLRENGPLWSQVVIWTAAIGTVMATLGILVGLLTLRPKGPNVIPYRGLMRWHYITGAVFGVFTLTWVFSGLLSMDPWGWADGGGLPTGRIQQVFRGGALDLEMYPRLDVADWERAFGGRKVKELSFERIQGDAFYNATLDDGKNVLVAAETLAERSEPYGTDLLMDQIRDAFAGESIVASDVLHEYDSYYYERGSAPPLPVLRVQFDDPEQTWIYVDPARSSLMRRVTSRDRLDRWIYNGFHSLDFSFWYTSRPLWDIGVIVLSLGGLSTTLIGMYLGFGRLGRGIASLVRR